MTYQMGKQYLSRAVTSTKNALRNGPGVLKMVPVFLHLVVSAGHRWKPVDSFQFVRRRATPAARVLSPRGPFSGHLTDNEPRASTQYILDFALQGSFYVQGRFYL